MLYKLYWVSIHNFRCVDYLFLPSLFHLNRVGVTVTNIKVTDSRREKINLEKIVVSFDIRCSRIDIRTSMGRFFPTLEKHKLLVSLFPLTNSVLLINCFFLLWIWRPALDLLLSTSGLWIWYEEISIVCDFSSPSLSEEYT